VVENAPKTVLVVEDEPSVRLLVRVALELQGYAVVDAAGPAEALEIAATIDRPIHLLVTDIWLGRSNVRALVAGLVDLGLDLPVLYLSGDCEPPANLPGCRKLFLGKPFELEQLEEAVAHLLEH
jgi:two-component system, cell cycle sensor histidine kinase and response regulator CckA